MKYIFFVIMILLVGNCQSSANKDIAEAVKSAPPSKPQVATPAQSAATVAQGAITLALETVKGEQGGTACIPMKVANFQAILSTQYSINWDVKELEFNTLKNFKVQSMGDQNFGLPLTDQGILTCVWVDPTLKGVTLPDGTTLFDICFNVVGEPKESVAKVALTERPTPFESVNLREEVLLIQTVDGGIKLN